MKKLGFVLASILCLALAGCENEDTRDNVIGSYTYTQTGYTTLNVGSQTSTYSLDDSGSLSISKKASSTTGVYFDGNDLLEEGWMDGNTLRINDVTQSASSNGATTTLRFTYSSYMTSKGSLTGIHGTINGYASYNGASYPITGEVVITVRKK